MTDRFRGTVKDVASARGVMCGERGQAARLQAVLALGLW
jgi:hypothetical protein